MGFAKGFRLSRQSCFLRQRQKVPLSNGEGADVGAEALRVARDFDQGLGCGSEQKILELARAGESEDVELMRHGEYDMEVGDGKQFLLPCLEPLLPRSGLALVTVAVAA
jgi:hypothetical protein